MVEFLAQIAPFWSQFQQMSALRIVSTECNLKRTATKTHKPRTISENGCDHEQAQ
jgi:hypothetical protein